MTPTEALTLIANGLPSDVLKWARLNNVDAHIITLLERGYVTNWHDAAEYRGALVHVHRRIAEAALDAAWHDSSTTG